MLGEDMLCAYDDLRDVLASLGSDEFDVLRPRASEGAGEGAPFRLALLELRRRVCGKGDDGIRAFRSRGETRPGDRSCELLVLAWSERRLTAPGREWEVASSLLCCAPLRVVVSLPAPPSECDGWWLCIAAGSQPVAARSNVLVGCFVSL